MGFFSRKKELKEEIEKKSLEIAQLKARLKEEIENKLLKRVTLAEEKKSEINKRYYLKHKNKENQKKEKIKHYSCNQEAILSTNLSYVPSGSEMSEKQKQYLKQQSRITNQDIMQ